MGKAKRSRAKRLGELLADLKVRFDTEDALYDSTYVTLIKAGRAARDGASGGPGVDSYLQSVGTLAMGLITWNIRSYRTDRGPWLVSAVDGLMASARDGKLGQLMAGLGPIEESARQRAPCPTPQIGTALHEAMSVLGRKQGPVAASKLLHWLCPEVLPPIDSNVTKVIARLVSVSGRNHGDSAPDQELYAAYTKELWELGFCCATPPSHEGLNRYWERAAASNGDSHVTPIRAVDCTLFRHAKSLPRK